ncbi:MAG: hypothetical protein JWO91_3844 [Acidobacteriaceae bacterium]|jgi:hypothetical protein|nr:hypothetical protein [Acidobacteriaceae bacterium]
MVEGEILTEIADEGDYDPANAKESMSFSYKVVNWKRQLPFVYPKWLIQRG